MSGVISNGNVVGDFNLLGSNDPGITGTNNQFNTDALLGPLTDNGGPTPTHALGLGSPALNAGDSDSAPHKEVVLGAGPSVFWEFEESSGAVINDATGAVNGTNNGGIRNRVGAGIGTGQSIEFDGVNDHLQASLTTSEIAGDSYSFSFWFEADDLATGQTLLHLNTNGGMESASLVELQSNGTLRFLNRLPANVGGGQDLFSVSNISSGWHHVAVVRSGGEMRMYLDGVLDSSRTGATGEILDDFDLSVGHLNPGVRQFDGRLDELAVYNHALNATEVEAQFKSRHTSFVDQRGDGFDRVGLGRIDIGAFELQDIIVSTTSDVSDGDFSPGELSLREAIELTNGMTGPGSIVFDSTFDTSQVIQLDSQLPTVTQPLTITGPGADLLTIDAGDGADGVFNTQDGFRIFEFNDSNNGIVQESVLSGMTITGADPVGFSQGGAIYNFESLLIQDSDIVANAGRYGAGIRNRVELTVTGSSFRDNEAFRGGGIRNTGTLIVDDSEFVSNTVGNDGGAISSNSPFPDDSVEITNSLFDSNTSLDQGGGIWAENATLTDVTVSNNSAASEGGGALNLGNSIFTNVVFHANTANDGGAIHSVGDLTLEGSTLGNNIAARGAAIFADEASSNVDINLTTITQNTANTAGSGAIEKVDASSTFVLSNTIVSDNFDSVGISNLVGTGFTGDFNLIGTGASITGADNLSSDDPMLTPTPGEFTFTPLEVSPVINAGDPAVQIPRVIGGVVDIGAVDANPAVVRNLGQIPAGASTQPAYDLREREVAFYRFELNTSLVAGSGQGLTIDTLGTTLDSSNDTELGLFDSQGNLVASNDDFDFSGLLSQLSFGDGGVDGDLAAGTYYLAISGFNTAYGASGFAANSTSDGNGDLVVNFELTLAAIDPDFNDDGNIDGIDINLLQANIVNGPADPAMFDLTGDGLVTIADRNEWLAQAGAANLTSGNPYLPGDANLDGFVDGSDFNAWNGSKFTANSDWTRGDFNADGFVDGSDFNIWNGNKFTAADSSIVLGLGSDRLSQSEIPSEEEQRVKIAELIFSTVGLENGKGLL